MVSGLVTSPCDQLRIFSGDASEMRIESKSAIRLALSYGEDLKIASNQENPCGAGKPGPDSQLVCRQCRVEHFPRLLHQLDVQAERLQFADQHVERFRHARLDSGLAFHDGLVDLGPSV